MYFWKDQELALRLGQGKVSEREKFLYFLGVLICDGVSIQLPYILLTLIKTGIAKNSLIVWIVQSLIVILGTIICYRSNKKHDGMNFVERIVVLSFPVGVRVFLYTMILSFCLTVAYLTISNITTPITKSNMLTRITEIVGIMGLFYQFYRLNKAIKIAASYSAKGRKNS